MDMRGLESWIIAKSLERLEAVSGAKGLRYDIKYRRLVLDWVNAESTPFDTLSDGQRGTVALVADIATRRPTTFTCLLCSNCPGCFKACCS